jgi:hypothetical protein
MTYNYTDDDELYNKYNQNDFSESYLKVFDNTINNMDDHCGSDYYENDNEIQGMLSTECNSKDKLINGAVNKENFLEQEAISKNVLNIEENNQNDNMEVDINPYIPPQILVPAECETISDRKIAIKLKTKPNQSRKNHPDCIRKKAKVHYQAYMISSINKKIKTRGVYSSSLQLQKINPDITSKIDIKFNKQLLDTKLFEIFSWPISAKNKRFPVDHNAHVIKQIRNDPHFDDILNKSYKDLYAEFLNSDSYKILKGKVRMEESKDYCEEFECLTEKFIWYYIKNEPNERKSPHNKRRDKTVISTISASTCLHYV